MRVIQGRKYAARSAAVAIMVMALGGCDAGPDDSGSADGGGPLVSQLNGGGNSLDAPRGQEHWSATFGSLTLCGDVPVTLREIRANFSGPPPENVEFWVRSVPATQERRGAPPGHWAPVLARSMSLEKLANSELSFSDLTPVAGAEVDQECSLDADASYVEVLTAMTVGRDGAWIQGLEVTYEADGEEFTLPVDWTYVACGRSAADSGHC